MLSQPFPDGLHKAVEMTDFAIHSTDSIIDESIDDTHKVNQKKIFRTCATQPIRYKLSCKQIYVDLRSMWW